mmetsp:Transcript_51925/g.116459  ORF Transcript_51925/g.116459 Transcript_51925/m.116459 type:complete len:895 (-) Transcript_51925:35-2719(-)
MEAESQTRDEESHLSGLTAEQRFASLKPYAHRAWEEWKDASASKQLRWEVFSTWMLLSCLSFAEAERNRAAEVWRKKAWTDESVALRHLFLESHSLRALNAVLRWLRWSHRWSPQASFQGGFVHSAGYEQTRRALQLHGRLPAPFQDDVSLHPDGPLQHGETFQSPDLEDERQLIADLWICLRRGELRKALQLCAESGQAWRAALLQGMLPFCEGESSEGEYESAYLPGDEVIEEMLVFMKEEHADWTEFGIPAKGGQGNPWRRVWKEECFNAASRNLLRGSAMDLKELSIYGFCSGNYDALMPSCSLDWADRCWGELHCLKEWLVEKLLEDGRQEHAACKEDPGFDTGRLGEGDLCAEEESTEDAQRRSAKLCGRLSSLKGSVAGSTASNVEAAVKDEVVQALQRSRPGNAMGWEAANVSQHFARLQAILIRAAWEPACIKESLALLRSWLRDDVPSVVKQFAAYLAVFQKEVLQEHVHAPVEIDDIVKSHVFELLFAATGSAWEDQCLRCEALEVILEHCMVMQPETRREIFTSLLLRLGCAAAGQVQDSMDALSIRGDATPLTEVVKRCFAGFWSRFPEEVFSVMAVLVRRVLKIDSEAAVPEMSGESDVQELVFVLLCFPIFWLVARDRSADGSLVDRSSADLSELVGVPQEDPTGLLGLLAGDVRQRFLRAALDRAVLPLLTDTLLCLCAKEPSAAVPLLPALQASSLWMDAFNSAASSTVNLQELEWFLLLHSKHREWKETFQQASLERTAAKAPALQRFGSAVRPGPGAGHAAEAEKASLESAAAREALLDEARHRLGQERVLLEPIPGTHTVLSDDHRQELVKVMAWRVLLPLLDCFETESDFQGAMQDLCVAVAESPWMLKTLDPKHAQSLLTRVAAIPMPSDAY